MAPNDPLNQPFLLLTSLRFVGLVEEALAEVDAAERVLVAYGDLVELDVGTGVLDVGLDQRSALLDRLDQDLFLPDGLLHERGLIRGQLVGLLVTGAFFAYAPDVPRATVRRVRAIFLNIMSSPRMIRSCISKTVSESAGSARALS